MDYFLIKNSSACSRISKILNSSVREHFKCPLVFFYCFEVITFPIRSITVSHSTTVNIVYHTTTKFEITFFCLFHSFWSRISIHDGNNIIRFTLWTYTSHTIPPNPKVLNHPLKFFYNTYGSDKISFPVFSSSNKACSKVVISSKFISFLNPLSPCIHIFPCVLSNNNSQVLLGNLPNAES